MKPWCIEVSYVLHAQFRQHTDSHLNKPTYTLFFIFSPRLRYFDMKKKQTNGKKRIDFIIVSRLFVRIQSMYSWDLGMISKLYKGIVAIRWVLKIISRIHTD